MGIQVCGGQLTTWQIALEKYMTMHSQTNKTKCVSIRFTTLASTVPDSCEPCNIL